jgi:tetratricopeptide (TPR) repeat protein
MSLRKLLPRGKLPEDIMRDLAPVFEGERLHKQERYGQAVIKYKQALEKFPVGSGGRFMIYNKIGIVYEKLGQSDQAIAIYQQGVKEGTITPFTYQRLAFLYLDSGRPQKAVEYCNRGLKCLKPAKTNLFQEIYFQILLRNLKRKAKHLLRGIRKS